MLEIIREAANAARKAEAETTTRRRAGVDMDAVGAVIASLPAMAAHQKKLDPRAEHFVLWKADGLNHGPATPGEARQAFVDAVVDELLRHGIKMSRYAGRPTTEIVVEYSELYRAARVEQHVPST